MAGTLGNAIAAADAALCGTALIVTATVAVATVTARKTSWSRWCTHRTCQCPIGPNAQPGNYVDPMKIGCPGHICKIIRLKFSFEFSKAGPLQGWPTWNQQHKYKPSKWHCLTTRTWKVVNYPAMLKKMKLVSLNFWKLSKRSKLKIPMQLAKL